LGLRLGRAYEERTAKVNQVRARAARGLSSRLLSHLISTNGSVRHCESHNAARPLELPIFCKLQKRIFTKLKRTTNTIKILELSIQPFSFSIRSKFIPPA
jgi:hypothetical protein